MVKINTRILASVLFAAFTLTSCAYFNTFYNARVSFDAAETSRIRKTSEMLPREAKENYLKVINKCNRVIEKYPDSKYIEEAEFLIGIARYHLGEILLSQTQFEMFIGKYPDSKRMEEAKYWIGLCHWRGGNPQYAILGLNELLDSTGSRDLKAKALLSLADIHLELGENVKAMNYFEEAAALSKEKHEKVLINERISDLAFKFGEWDRAEKAYKEVIRNSFLKDQKENAQLQIVKIYRLKDENDKAMNLIRKLLQDENFKTLHGDLELEMAKLYLKDRELEKAVQRLKKITTDYPKTASSAEAYYLLGEDALTRQFNLDQALTYFTNIATEYSQSVFRPFSKTRITDINVYKQNLEEYRTATMLPVGTDSLSDADTTLSEIPEDKKSDVEKLLFTLAELEYLQFKRLNESTVHYEELVDLQTGSDLMIKSIYILGILYERLDQKDKKDEVHKRLLNEFPYTDYAGEVRKKLGLGLEIATPGQLLLDAEREWLYGDRSLAIDLYKDVIILDKKSSSARISYMFLANYYENIEENFDSAYAYYKIIEKENYSDDHVKIAQKSIGSLKKILGIEDIAVPVPKEPMQSVEPSSTPEITETKLNIKSDEHVAKPDSLGKPDAKKTKVPVLEREGDMKRQTNTGKRSTVGEPSID